jgi:hypothetical protein
MSRSRKIFGLVAKQIAGTVLCKDVLVLKLTGHVLRGFTLETSSVKNMVYVWRVITPLHRPMKHPFLDYSKRINHGEPFHVDERAAENRPTALQYFFGRSVRPWSRSALPKRFFDTLRL